MDDVVERLRAHYVTVNPIKFEGLLPPDFEIRLNPNLRRLTGRITYAARLIEISEYHLRHYGFTDAVATLEHELLHLYLHAQGKPSGHNPLFKQLAHERGIRVFHSNPYPQNRQPRHRYVYECPACLRMVFRRRRHVRDLACGVCCRLDAGGVWDPRFRLRLIETVNFG
jgi:predicted SprT family Zn-dependent metalloprotease